MADIIDAPITKREEAPLATTQSDVSGLIRVALEKGINPTELYAILREERAARAESEFNAAFAAFKAECPQVPRRHRSQFDCVDRDGVKKPRMYADLEDIDATVTPVLSKHGLALSFGDMVIANDMLTRTAILSHVGGHQRKATATMPVKSNAGCSEAQKYGSADTYAKRAALTAVTGVTSCDEDDDGAGDGTAETITDDQARTLNDLLIESGADKAKFLAWALPNVARDDRKIADIPAKMFDTACKLLNDKITEKRKGKA